MERALSAQHEVYTPRRPPGRHFIDLRGMRYRLWTWGPESGLPVILLHGWGDCGATWQFIADRLPAHWRLVAPDWRGFGDSGWAPGGYWFPDYLADLDALLQALYPGRAVNIAGHSMGGNVAAIYAAARPERVTRLANLEGFGLRAADPDEAPARYRRWLDELDHAAPFQRYRDVGALADRLVRRNPHLPRDRALFVAEAWTASTASGEVALRTDPAHRRVNPVLYRRSEAEACWQAIDAPVLFLVARHSHFLDRDRRQFIDPDFGRSHYRHLEERWLEDCGHMMHWEQPGAVADALAGFIEPD